MRPKKNSLPSGAERKLQRSADLGWARLRFKPHNIEKRDTWLNVPWAACGALRLADPWAVLVRGRVTTGAVIQHG